MDIEMLVPPVFLFIDYIDWYFSQPKNTRLLLDLDYFIKKCDKMIWSIEQKKMQADDVVIRP